MPQELLSMRKLREVLRLKLCSQLSNRSIGRAVCLSPSTVSYYVRAAIDSETDWTLISALSDAELTARLAPFCRQLYKQPREHKVEPSWPEVHRSLSKKGVTLQLLYEEYQQRYGEVKTYSYSAYCAHYRGWLKIQKPSMRMTHKAGEKVFVDYAGPTIPIYSAEGGVTQHAKLFVGALGVSQYIYAEATLTRGISDWIGSHVRMLNYFGGVPELIVPDNEKAGVNKACYYDPELNPNYAAFAAHYGTAVLPTRPRKPQDKGKVENAVQLVERWIMARLRHYRFFSLRDLNQQISQLLEILNHRPFKNKAGCRYSAFMDIDKPALNELTTTPYQVCDFKSLCVRTDYHVEVEKHYYSVPYQLINQEVECRISEHMIAIYHQHQRVALHPRQREAGGTSTQAAHMPSAHHQHQSWTPDVFLHWAKKRGCASGEFATRVIATQKHPECCYRIYLGLTTLAKRFGDDAFEQACRYALTYIEKPDYRSLKSILDTKVYLQTHPHAEDEKTTGTLASKHKNVRGSGYYTLITTEENHS